MSFNADKVKPVKSVRKDKVKITKTELDSRKELEERAARAAERAANAATIPLNTTIELFPGGWDGTERFFVPGGSSMLSGQNQQYLRRVFGIETIAIFLEPPGLILREGVYSDTGSSFCIYVGRFEGDESQNVRLEGNYIYNLGHDEGLLYRDTIIKTLENYPNQGRNDTTDLRAYLLETLKRERARGEPNSEISIFIGCGPADTDEPGIERYPGKIYPNNVIGGSRKKTRRSRNKSSRRRKKTSRRRSKNSRRY